MDDLAEYINSLTLHVSIRNWLYRVERTSKATTPDDFMRDLITSVGAFVLSQENYDNHLRLPYIRNAIDAVAEFLEVDISKYNLTDLWGVSVNEQELTYIGSFDPYEQEEFEKRIVRVIDAVTGVQITPPVQVATDAELIAHLAASIRASYDKQVLVIYVEKERNDSRWDA